MRLRAQSIAAAFLGVLLALLLSAPGLLEARVQIKPGFNTFSPEQDVQLGQEAIKEVEQQMPVVSDAQLTEYVNRLGQNLAKFAPGYRFPYRFGVINEKEINAFALPGGPVYVNRGTILAAANEAQLAGVLAHEISHVALRHSTNQASKQMLARAPLSILGGLVGSGGGLAGQLAQLGIAFGINSVFLKFSRSAEQQADELGSQIMYDAGYDPTAMAQFFQVIEKQGGSGAVEFLSSHPNPGNRYNDVTRLIPTLGPAKSFNTDSGEFQAIQQRASGLRDSGPVRGQRGTTGPISSRAPAEPSHRFRSIDADGFSVGYPDNWQVYGGGSSTLTIVPPEGVIQANGGSMPAIAYGALVSIYEPVQDGRRITLQVATDQLLQELQSHNPNLRVTDRARRARLAGQEAFLVNAAGDSPIPGESETNLIVTTFRPEGLWYVVFIAPQRYWGSFEPAFRQMLNSVRFR
jgi:Zn-dependent protease with chaperone function